MFRSISYGPCSRTGVTCVASDFGGIIWLQMASLISVHGRGSLSDVIWPPSLFSCASWIHGSVFLCSSFFNDTEWAVAWQWSPTPVGLSRFVCSLNLWPSVLLVLPMYVWLLSMCSWGVLSLIGVLPSSGGCLPACGTCVCYVPYKSGLSSDSPAIYGSPSIDLRGLLFVLGGLFALDGAKTLDHPTRTAHEDLCWDYHTWQDYQNSLARYTPTFFILI